MVIFLRRVVAFAALVAGVGLLAACEAGRLQPLPPDGVILAFGDSLTAGKGTSRDNSYPSVLAQLSGRTVINAGISGELTDEGLARLPGMLDQHRPDLMILIEGGNDILQNRTRATKNNLAQMIELAQGRGIEVVLIGVPEKNLFSNSAPFYEELADEYALAYHDELISDLLRQPSYKSDSVHFNADGYREMAEGIYELLQDQGAL